MFKLNEVFTTHDNLKPLLREAEFRSHIQQLWSNCVPEYAKYSHVISCKHGTLYIAAYSGALATRIKLQERALLTELQQLFQKSKQIKGLNLNAIKVKVQVKTTLAKPQKRIAPPSQYALSTLESCAKNIKNPDLQTVIRRFVRRQST